MGVITRKPVLPAPTDSSAVDSAVESVAGTDLATDLSKVTDRSHYSIPDDGRPITITTHKKGDKGKLSHGHHPSQTSLLIEYFEAGKEGSDLKARPSIRVKVTPSSKARKGKEQHDHLLVTESGSTRRPSHTRRISLGTDDSHLAENKSASSLHLVTDDPSRLRRNPAVEVELLNRSDISGSSVSREARYVEPASDISSMPPDSMLEGATTTARPERSRSLSRDEIALEKEKLKAPSRRRSRSLSRERQVTQKVIEKLKPQESSSGRRHHSSRSRSVSHELLEEEETRSPRRRSRKYREDDSLITGAESGLTGSSLLSPNRKSGDQYSFRSGTSKSSINNPRLLETVEDAIRRLILPELKELKKDQKVEKNRKVFERDTDSSLVSGSSISREEPRRRVSKHSSGRPRVVVKKDSKDSEELLSSGSRRRKERKHYDYDSPSERSTSRRQSGDSTMIEDEKARHRRREHRVRDAAVGALAGGALTAAALKHHDSKSSIDRKERRKRRSKSRSRSASIAESEEIFEKHEVPPMPMRSEVDSELTRSSLLSEQTASTTTPTHREVRNVVRGSPREMRSPTAGTPTRTSGNLQKGFGTHHGNASKGDLSLNSRTETEPSLHSSEASPVNSHHRNLEEAALAGIAGGAAGLAGAHILDERERVRRYEQNLHHQHPIRRGLSPIQSVASYREDASEPNRDSVLYDQSNASSSALDKHGHLREGRSFDSISSAHSIGIAKKRPVGVSLEKGDEILAQHDHKVNGSYDKKDVDDWYDEQHRENDKYRDSYNSSQYDDRRATTYTDDSFDGPYEDQVGAGQHLARGAANNPEYMHTPEAVESAVASLYEPSVLDTRSQGSSHGSFAEGLDREALSPKPLNYSGRDLSTTDKGSPLKQSYVPDPDLPSFHERAAAISPPQSVAESEDRDLPEMGASGIPIANDPLPEIGHGLESPNSEITTNPSVIQGPIGGISHENRDHWPYDPTPSHSKGDMMSPTKDRHGLSATEAALAGAAAGAGLAAMKGRGDDKFDRGQDDYMRGQTMTSPLENQDEGYISGKPPTTGALTPDLKGNTRFDNGSTEAFAADDPFVGHNRHVSGFSHGLESPLYDSANGQGIDRIQSKDIVALMDHLTVRDAQRNARDTEILVTLVRSAAEMRNSFEDMKRFIADQDEYIMDTGDKQHEKTVNRIIGGPRPQPVGSRFTPRKSFENGEDMSTKRRNVFQRALRGLGAKNNAELQNIEAMLNHLLGEVGMLRAAQEGRPSGQGTNSMHSGDNYRVDDGYEPEGQAGTSSTGGDRSDYMSNNSSRQGVGFGSARRASENPNRVSTVMEGDEDPEPLQPHEEQVLDPTNEDHLLTPTRDMRDSREKLTSVPMSIPRKPVSYGDSNENTPRISINSKPDKHKSSSSSFFPKISRWSKTTASSVGDAFRTSTQSKKDRPYSQVSHSGEDLAEEYEYEANADDRLRSNTSFNRPASPLVPSQVSEDPKFQAHRNSLNLQHPQPRQGPTGRYQHHLETQADTYGPTSPTASEAEHWAAMAEPRLLPTGMDGGNERGRDSPLSEIYSDSSSAMMELGEEEARRSATSSNSVPPRPPKVRDDGPLVPERPPKIAMSPAPNTRQPTYVDHVAAQRGSTLSPTAAAGTSRKPSGPRPITGSGQWGSPGRSNANGAVANGENGGHLADVKKTRFRGSPNHIESSSEESIRY